MMNKALDLVVTSVATVVSAGLAIAFTKATVENTKSLGKAFMSIIKK